MKNRNQKPASNARSAVETKRTGERDERDRDPRERGGQEPGQRDTSRKGETTHQSRNR